MHGDGIAYLLAELLAEFRADGQHMPAGAGDHEANIVKRQVVHGRIDTDGSAGIEEIR